MEAGNMEISYNNNTNRLPHETARDIMSYKGQYGIPESYNPADHPPVKMRSSNHHDSETQRKRRSKNRLSNRRSTGYVNEKLVEEAFTMGPEGSEQNSAAK